MSGGRGRVLVGAIVVVLVAVGGLFLVVNRGDEYEASPVVTVAAPRRTVVAGEIAYAGELPLGSELRVELTGADGDLANEVTVVSPGPSPVRFELPFTDGELVGSSLRAAIVAADQSVLATSDPVAPTGETEEVQLEIAVPAI